MHGPNEKKRNGMIGAILAVLFLLVSCGSGSSENGSPELDITSPTGAATVYGKIIDVSTRRV